MKVVSMEIGIDERTGSNSTVEFKGRRVSPKRGVRDEKILGHILKPLATESGHLTRLASELGAFPGMSVDPRGSLTLLRYHEPQKHTHEDTISLLRGLRK